MYYPFPGKRLPTNRERRVASIECMLGFAFFGWIMLVIPGTPVLFALELAPLLILTGHGLATMLRATPDQAALWQAPRWLHRLRWRMGWTRNSVEVTLDERDLQIRYQTFLISYQILAGVIIATLVAALLANVLTGSPAAAVAAAFRADGAGGLRFLVIRTLIVLVLLFSLLPYFVLPWLESAVPFDQDLANPTAPAVDDSPPPRARLDWVRILGNTAWWLIAVVAILTFVWALGARAH